MRVDLLVVGIGSGVHRGFCMIEATALLRRLEHIVRAVTKVVKRTMTGGQVNEVIAMAVAAKADEDERQRRESAALFKAQLLGSGQPANRCGAAG
jgi:hypothetical protein